MGILTETERERIAEARQVLLRVVELVTLFWSKRSSDTIKGSELRMYCEARTAEAALRRVQEEDAR